MKQTFLLRNDSVRQNAIEFLRNLPTDKDKPITIRISEYKRNLEQNAKFHAMCSDISRQCLWCGKKLTLEQWKVLLISGHAVATKQGAEIVPGIEGEFVNIRESSAQMSISRMASLIEYVNCWAAGQNVRFTDTRYL